MAGKKGYKAVEGMRRRGPTIGAEARADGLDRSEEGNMALLMDGFLEALTVKNYSERTVERRRGDLVMFLRWAEERDLRRPETITKPILESYQRYLWRYRKENGKPLSISSQTSRLTALRMWFRWMCRENYLGADPAAHLEMPKQEVRLPMDTLSVEEVARIMAVPDVGDVLGLRDRAMLEVLYSTGIRRAEMARLELGDVNLDRETVNVRKGKGGKDRVVPLGKRALKWLEKYLDRSRPQLQIEMAERALFLTGFGGSFSPTSLGDLISRRVKAGLGCDRSGSCHLLRHACATHMLEGGADIRVIQQLLGHKNLETTQIYTQVSIALLKEVHAETHPSEKSGDEPVKKG